MPGASSDMQEVVAGVRGPAAGGEGEFTITVDKTSGTRLGVDVDHQDGKTLLIEAVTGGLMEKWNNENSSKKVANGMRIVEVNKLRGDVLQLVDECKKNKVHTMVISRN